MASIIIHGFQEYHLVLVCFQYVCACQLSVFDGKPQIRLSVVRFFSVWQDFCTRFTERVSASENMPVNLSL